MSGRTNFNLVRHWHQKFQQAAPAEPSKVDDKRLQQRVRMLRSELKEFLVELKGLNKPHMYDTRIAFAKELCDVLFVMYGFGVELGIDIDAVFYKVFLSNMTKMGRNGKPILKDGKVQKGPDYKEAEITYKDLRIVEL